VIALSKLYDLKDPRLSEIQVRGDLIPSQDTRIRTRSRTLQSKPLFRDSYASFHKFYELFAEAQWERAACRRWDWHKSGAPPIKFLFDSFLPFCTAFKQCVRYRALTKSTPTDPDQYTLVPANLKILKVLIVELQSAAGSSGRELDAAAAAELAEEGSNDDDEGWEDETNPFLDLGSAMSKEQLMAFADEAPGAGSRIKDDETQAFLVDFFKRAASTQEFAEEFAALKEEERRRLHECAG